MSNFIKEYTYPSGSNIAVEFVDNRGFPNNHPGGLREYDKDYYFAVIDGDRMSMTEFNKYVKDSNLKIK